MVRIFKNDARLRKPFPLLIRFSDTGEAPENLNAAPEDLNATPEDPLTKFGKRGAGNSRNLVHWVVKSVEISWNQLKSASRNQ